MSRFTEDAADVRSILQEAVDKIEALHPDHRNNVAQAMLWGQWSTQRALLQMMIRDLDTAIERESSAVTLER